MKKDQKPLCVGKENPKPTVSRSKRLYVNLMEDSDQWSIQDFINKHSLQWSLQLKNTKRYTKQGAAMDDATLCVDILYIVSNIYNSHSFEHYLHFGTV